MVETGKLAQLFQSTPVIADGRAATMREHELQADWFQSTPVIADGRAESDRGAVLALLRFNPRPSLLTGEPVNRLPRRPHPQVSIHARHC